MPSSPFLRLKLSSISYLTNGRVAVSLPMRTTVTPVPFNSRSIHAFTAASPFFANFLPSSRIHELVSLALLGKPAIADLANAPTVLLVMETEKYPASHKFCLANLLP